MIQLQLESTLVISCIGRWVLYHCATCEALENGTEKHKINSALVNTTEAPNNVPGTCYSVKDNERFGWIGGEKKRDTMKLRHHIHAVWRILVTEKCS